MEIQCRFCPLRRLPAFETLSAKELAITEKLKRGELRVETGTPILSEGSASPQLFTVLEGQGIRYKTLEDGKRQVLSFVFPGDFLGLQAAVMSEMTHSVVAASPMLLCVFDRADLVQLYRESPERAFDLTWLAAEEESMMAEALSTVGQQGARARMAWGLLRLMYRARISGMADGDSAPMPFRQQDLADALGLSVVHTNKTLAALRSEGLATLRDRRLTIHDRAGLERLVGAAVREPETRPLI
jgi:CRP-like cAMP-binding protein